MHRTSTSSPLPWLVILTFLSSAAAGAEDPGTSALEEVVVTATKRSADLQDLPLSMTALSAKTLERSGELTFEDYATKIPNLTYAAGFGVIDGHQIAIRGVQGVDTVGFYIDDLPVPPTMDPRVVDLQRIEVLRGPQGTLYGARSEGGTVRLITQEPDPDNFSARTHALGNSIEGGEHGYQVDAAVNIPILPGQLAARFSGYDGADGAFIERTFPDSSNPSIIHGLPVARNDVSGGMAALLWQVTSDLTIRPILMTQSSTLNGWPLSDVSPDALRQTRPFDIAEPAHDRWTYGGVAVNLVTSLGKITSASSWFSRRADETEDGSDFVAYVLGTPLLPAALITTKPSHRFVEELRFTSTFPGAWQLTGGVYWLREQDNYNQILNVPGINAASGGAFGTDLVYGAPGPGFTHETAGFGELTYRIDPHWSLTAGARYTELTQSRFFYESGIAVSGSNNGGGTESEDLVTPKAVIQYEHSPDSSVYALASKGFRPGNGQVAPPVSLCEGDYSAAGLTPQQLSKYASDNLWNYEVGTKNRFFDRRLALNASLFWIDWKNLQQASFFSCGFAYTFNAGAARSRGGELELSAVPLDHFNVTVGVGYTDAVITQSSPTSQTPVGTPVQQIAPWTVSASGDYAVPIAATLEGFGRVDSSYTDHSWSANNDRVNPRLRPSYSLVNLHLGVRAQRWETATFVNNIGNTHANLGDDISEVGEVPGRPRIYVNPPRSVGLEATLRW